MKRYWLHRHIYMCVMGDVAVWLDLRRDRYFGTSGSDLLRLGSLIDGLDSSASPSTDDCVFADELQARGFLTRRENVGKPVSVLEMDAPTAYLVDDDGSRGPSVQLHHIWHFVRACIVAFAHLKVRSLWYAVESLDAVKTMQRRRWTEADTARSRDLVRIFLRLRPFCYTAKLACLFDSLALVRFLEAYDIYPSFAIGVAVQPFHAHCWVQQGALVFNSEPTFTQQFKPILAI